ncbi:CDP-alcohol phosphatidyltransferase family protein [Candidatus Paracaedibacter symbiosus]|uniref:CDP-alcohol phosphatidyltransferase family protein n=1 Tax=Candidatus Paracaedibacter symbiosus TaxID=244582 RepID=UPI000691B029|nr:CDP-alcohol phosphatidyltransferase family protein [Candidatus Paracaedibacter symbiosus]
MSYIPENPAPCKKTGIYRHLPNLITLLRLFATPLTYVLIMKGFFGSAFLCFVFAGISDGIDGYLARRWHVSSKFGRIFDPIADKALMFIAYFTLGLAAKLPLWLVILVISRDGLILLCSFFTVLFRSPIRLTPVWSSKVNTCVQIVLVGAVLVAQTDYYGLLIPKFAQTGLIALLIYAAALTTIWSGCEYGLYFIKQLYHLYGRGSNVPK